MHFGRNEIDITNFDHHLPADSVRTLRVFENAQPVGDFEAFVGAPIQVMRPGYRNRVSYYQIRSLKKLACGSKVNINNNN